MVREWATAPLLMDTTEDTPPRSECIDGPRPCLRSRCRYHVAHGVQRGSHHGFHGPRILVGWESDGLATCALDVAEAGGAALSTVGLLLGITRQRAQQIEFVALRKFRAGLRAIDSEVDAALMDRDEFLMMGQQLRGER